MPTVKPPLLAKEANLALWITPHKGKDHSCFLATLEPINTPKFDARVAFLEGG